MKKNKKINKEIKKRKITAYVLATLIILVVLLINRPTVIRLFLTFIALTVYTVAICYRQKKLKKYVPLIVILLIFSSMILDSIICYSFKRIPIYSYNIITKKNTKVYNSLGIIVWQCDKNNYNDLKVTPFYERGFTCNPEEMPAIDSNSFLQEVQNNHSEYKNKYIKIKGKISKISGENILEMQAYEESELTLNGYVEFLDTITLRVILDKKEDLNTYDIYDDVTVVGIIKNIETSNNKSYIYMYEGKIVSDIDLNYYTITTSSIKNCEKGPELLYSDGFSNIYSYCVNDVIISYDQDNKYELSAALSANKITIDKMIDDSKKEKEENGNILYTNKNYNLISCKDIYVIGDTNLSLKDDVCSLINIEN